MAAIDLLQSSNQKYDGTLSGLTANNAKDAIDEVQANIDALTFTDAFKTIAVAGQSNIVADANTDTLTIVDSTDITITTDAGTDTLTVAHSTVSSTQSDAANNALAHEEVFSAITGVTVSSQGHVTDVETTQFTMPAGAVPNDGQITFVAGEGLSYSVGDGIFTVDQASNESFTLDIALSELTTSTADADGDYFVVVDTVNAQKKLTKANIALSGFNNDLGNYGSFVTSVTGGTGITSTGGTTPSLSLTVDELSEKTGDLVGTDRLVGTSGTTNFAETISAISLSIFNNDLSWIALTDLSVGAEGAASGDGSIAYENTTGVFTYTPPLNITGNAATANQWTTTRTINMTGDVTSDAVNIDGSGNITITNTVVGNDSHTHDANNLTGTTLNPGVVTSSLTTLGTVTNFTSTGIDDNATSTAITIASDQQVTISGDVIITGDATVQGNTVTLNTQELTVEDANIIVASTATTDAQADGAGITFGGQVSAPTFNYVNSSDRFVASNVTGIEATTFTGALSGNASTASQWQTTRTIGMSGDVTSDAVNIDGSGNITITNTVVGNDTHTHDANNLTGTTLASGVTASSLTSVGTLTSLTSSGDVEALTFTIANWQVSESANSIYFAFGGINRMKLDDSGNLQVTGDVETLATIT